MLTIHDPKSYDDLSAAEKLAVQMWIAMAVRPGDLSFPATSAGLKLNLQIQEGVFITNGEFKGGMRAAGYEPTNVKPGNAIDWYFPLLPTCKPLHEGKVMATVHACVESAAPRQKRMFKAVCLRARGARLDRLQREAEERVEAGVKAKEMRISLSAARAEKKR